MALDEKSGDHIHPEGGMNVYTKLHWNPSSICQDIWL